MESIVYGAKPGFENMCVNLRRRQIGMPQHRLNGPKIRTVFKQMRGKRVSQHVRADRPWKAGAQPVRLEILPEADATEGLAPRIHQDERGALSLVGARACQGRAGLLKVPLDPLGRLISDRNHPLLVALA